MSKIQFEMSQEQLDKLMNASKAVPAIMLHIGGGPRSPQQNANDAWSSLGEEMGFDHFTVEQVKGQPNTIFRAEAVKKDD